MIQFRCSLCKQISNPSNGPREIDEIDLEKSVITFANSNSHSPTMSVVSVVSNEVPQGDTDHDKLESGLYLCPICLDKTDMMITSSVRDSMKIIKESKKLLKDIENTQEDPVEIDDIEKEIEYLRKEIMELDTECEKHEDSIREIERFKFTIPALKFNPIHVDDDFSQLEREISKISNFKNDHKICLEQIIINNDSISVNGITHDNPSALLSELVFILHNFTQYLVDNSLFDPKGYKLIPIYEDAKIIILNNGRTTHFKLNKDVTPLFDYIDEVRSQLGITFERRNSKKTLKLLVHHVMELLNVVDY